MTVTNTQKHSPFRYDIVGSFLRPDELKSAREKFANGEITQEELTKVEDQAIIDLINKQEEVGLKAVTDGEFRRSWWHLDFFWGLNGIEKADIDEGYQFEGVETRRETAIISGKISGENHPFVEDFKFTQAHVSDGIEVKQTIPAAAQLYLEFIRPQNIENTKSHYDTREELFADVAKAYQQVIQDLYGAGARTIQLDDTTWGSIVADEYADQREELAEAFITLNNAVLENKPEDLTVNTHICRGNYKSTWVSSGGYASVASPLFDRGNYHGYYLEYDSDRSGDFQPLEKVSDDKKVVLGLVTSKSGELEDKQAIIDRIKEASEYVPLENLCLSPQCGFASTEEGNILTEEAQWDKIRLIKEIAEEVWQEN